MIQKRHYFVLTLLMLLIFVLFQVTVTTSYFGDTQTKNPYDYAKDIPAPEGGDSLPAEQKEAPFVIVTGVGRQMPKRTEGVKRSLACMKQRYAVASTLAELSAEQLETAQTLIITASRFDDVGTVDELKHAMQGGRSVIFATLPARDELDETELQVILGIRGIREYYEQEGLRVFPGFLLGGWGQYEDYTFDALYTKVRSSCKSYIVGEVEDAAEQGLENEDLPDILWRNYFEGSPVFVVNAPFFETSAGPGMLAGMLSEMQRTFVYPVINARCLVVENLPYLSNENRDVLMQLYSRDAERFLQDIVFPGLVSLGKKTDNLLSCFATSSFDSSAVSREELNLELVAFYKQELAKVKGELALSGFDRVRKSGTDKLLADLELYSGRLGGYLFSAFAPDGLDRASYAPLLAEGGALDGVRALVGPWAADVQTEPEQGMDFTYFNSRVVQLPITSTGFVYSDEGNLSLRSAASALGVITHSIDMAPMIYPESGDDDWKYGFVEFAKNIDTYWKPFQALDALTVSEAAQREMRWLALQPQIEVGEDQVRIRMEGFHDKAFFYLRSWDKVTGVDHGSFEKLEDRVYLIRADAPEIVVSLEHENRTS